MRWRLPFLALALGLLLGAAEPIRIGTGDWTTLNPLLMSQDTDSEAVDLLFDRLVTLDAQGQFVPQMLESWTVLQGGREVVLKLRPGLAWQDGRPVEAEDLVFTWKCLRLPKVREVSADAAAGITSLDHLQAEGPLTVRVRLARPRGSLLTDLYNFIPVPRHRYQVPADPRKMDVNFQPVGSGPYRAVGRPTRTHLVLERWEGYKGPHPGAWPSFEILTRQPGVKMLPALASGAFHFAQVAGLRNYLARKVPAYAQNIVAMQGPQASVSLLFLNCDPRQSLLGDRTLRKALAELVPWQDFARGNRFFPVRRATTFWPPEVLPSDGRSRPLPSLARAEALLDQAGWPRGADGWRHDAQGRPLILNACQDVGGSARSPLRMFAEQAARAGVRVVLHQATLAEMAAPTRKGDIWSFAWAFTADLDVDSPVFTTAGIPTGANVCRYRNPKVDQLFQEGRHTLDQAARRRIYRQISDILDQDMPVIPLTYSQSDVLMNRRLKGVQINHLGQTWGFWPGRRAWKLEP